MCPLGTLRRVHGHRCLGVAVFYNTQHFEKTAEMRVFFPEHIQRLRQNSSKKLKRPDGSDVAVSLTVDGAVRADAAAGRGRKHATSTSTLKHSPRNDSFCTEDREITGTVDPAPLSRLEADLRDKPDAAVMVRLRLKETGGEEHANRANGKADKQPSFTLVCCHLWFDPLRPDLKTAQCRILFDAIQQLHDKCGLTGRGGTAGVEQSEQQSLEDGLLDSDSLQNQELGCSRNSGPANLILCGDFNSVPIVNPDFLPGALKVSGNTGGRSCF